MKKYIYRITNIKNIIHLLFTHHLDIFVLIMYPTIAMIITETSATPILRPISFILRVSFSVDGLSVTRCTVLGGTVWAVAVEVAVWTPAVEDRGWTTAIEDRDEAVVVNGVVSSVVQSKMRSRNH